jgi:hypothetical protein
LSCLEYSRSSTPYPDKTNIIRSMVADELPC